MRSSSLQSVLLFLCLISLSKAWDNDELEIFDLVEEVNGNFYEYLEVKPDAGTSEIKKAYRRLSLILHPDKNDAEDASIKFRW
jgi:DnaJ family protein C protein 1